MTDAIAMRGSVPTLFVTNGYAVRLPGLGKMQDFSELSDKRVTKSVRAALRDQYERDAVQVSCSASFRREVSILGA